MTKDVQAAFFSLPQEDLRSFPSVQTTLAGDATLSGVGLFTGERVSVTISPRDADTGIVFERRDLSQKVTIPAHLSFVQAAHRCTRLKGGENSIYMVEHLLSALYGMGIDNAFVSVHGPEIPSVDGSSLPFVEAIEKTGLKRQEAPRRFIHLKSPVYWSEGDVHLVALPAQEFRISYTMHYPESPLLRSQYYSFCLHPDLYKREIAMCRTFSLYEEILPFIEKGLIKGGGLENALVIQGNRILNPEGARVPDEMVRHKVLDLIGDLALIGRPILAHVIAIRSGHATNVAFAKVLSKQLQLR